MISALRFAFGNARVRGMKSRLRTPEDAAVFRSAASLSSLVTSLGVGHPQDAGELNRLLFAELVADYRKVLASYPSGGSLFRALLRLHEVENLKLGWRARVRSLAPERWVHIWRPLGSLEALRLEDWRDADSLRQAAGRARGDPYEGIVRETFGAHEKDAAAAELAFDRWAWAQLAEEARKLPRRERVARKLVLSRVRERDLDALRRAVVSYRLPPDVALGTAVLLREEERSESLRKLAEWTPDSGALHSLLPRHLLLRPAVISGWNDLRIAIRRQRYEACRRAFLGYPFRLAPPTAYLLLREEEVRGLTALAESRGMPEPGEVLERVLAPSAMGA